MANTITLRAYLDELEHLLDARSPTEVISHCRYILQHYPRNVEAYRLLGRALLERGERDGVAEHYDEALEMFRRVLSVLPDDHTAHLGVSQIFQEKGDLERAIWHLERAYEQMPGNPALQEALRELYAQRSDAEEMPARLQLTRGALARQYIRAQQYEQALVELRAALSEEKDTRLDLQVLLAEVLWISGHKEEAAEQAARILEVLPDCLEANRILARYWLEHERPSDAQVFLDRIEAVDPYAARSTLQPDTDAPDPNRLPRLDYGTQAQAATSAETPDWVDELGDLGDFSMEQGSPFTAEPETSAPPLETEALFGAAFQPDISTPESPEWPADWAAEADAPAEPAFDFGEWPEPSEPQAPPMPSVTDTNDAPDFGMDWLTEPDAGTSAPEPSEPQTPDDAPLPADWLDDVPQADESAVSEDVFGAETFATPSTEDDRGAAVGEAPPTEASEPAAAAEAEPVEASAEDEAAWLFSLGESEAAELPFDESGEETANAAPSPTGFTDLLAGIQAQSAAQEMSWGEDEGAEAGPEPEPPDWLADFVDADTERTSSPEPVAEQGAESAEADESPADIFELLEDADAESAPPPSETGETSPQAQQPSPLDAPEWLTEPEYDFFAPEETVADEGGPTAPPEAEGHEQDAGDDWLETLEEADESDLADVLLSAADEWQAAEETSSELDWLSEDAAAAPADAEAVDALFAAVEEEAAAKPAEAQLSEEPPAPLPEAEAEPPAPEQEEDWLATLPTDEEAVLTAAESGDAPSAAGEADVTLAEGEAAVQSVLDTLEADVPTLEESVDEPVAFEAVEESLFGEAEENTGTSSLSALEERVAQFTQSEETPAWLAGMEAEVSFEDSDASADDEQTVHYQAAGQTGILQPDEAPAWMAAFTGEEVPVEPETEAPEEAFGAPEAEITPPPEVEPDATMSEASPAAEDFSTRILQPETPPSAEEFDLFAEEPDTVSASEGGLDTDELFADVLGGMSETVEATEAPEEGDLPAWLQAITQSEADKLDESLFEEAEPYSSSAEDSGILQPGQEDEWLQVLGGEEPTSAEPTAQGASEARPTTAPEATDEPLFGEDEGASGAFLAEAGAATAEASEDDEAALDFLDLDAAAIAEMDFEDIAAELEEVAQPDALDGFEEMPEASGSEGEEPTSSAVAEVSDLSHTMAEDARISAAYEEETVEVSATPEDDFSFDGMVPRWLRRPRENVSGDALDVVPEDDTPPSPPEWLRDVSEDLDRQDRDDLQ